jgi:hypothetical protein
LNEEGRKKEKLPVRIVDKPRRETAGDLFSAPLAASHLTVQDATEPIVVSAMPGLGL